MQTLTIRRDQAVPGIVFASSHGYKVLVTHVIDDAEVRSDDRHVQIEDHLHANPGRPIVVERYTAGSSIEVESFGPLPEGCETADERTERRAALRGEDTHVCENCDRVLLEEDARKDPVSVGWFCADNAACDAAFQAARAA
jgi:hypothetical protein